MAVGHRQDASERNEEPLARRYNISGRQEENVLRYIVQQDDDSE